MLTHIHSHSTLPLPPFDALAASPQTTPEIPMNLSWNERRKLRRYIKQTEKDAAKSAREQERERQREEKAVAKQWKQYYKAEEKEMKKWRKATVHHPELNYPSGVGTTLLHQQSHHHALHLRSPHVTHASAYRPTLPLPHAFPTNTGSFTAQYLPINGHLGSREDSPPLLPSLAAFGVVHPSAGPGAHGSVMSRTMTRALLELEQDTYLRFGQRGLIR